MAVKRVRNHGKWVWQARVSYRGRRRAAVRDSKDAALDAERELKAEAVQAEQAAARPATLCQLLEFLRPRHGGAREGGRERSSGWTTPAARSRP
jgi:uncharacterized protein YaiL (DUF2058 family)